MSKGFTIWFTGLSGAGKSTLSALLERELHARGHRVEVLVGIPGLKTGGDLLLLD